MIVPYVLSLLFLGSLFFVPNNTVLFLDAGCTLILLTLAFKNFRHALLLLFFLTIPFQKGITIPFSLLLRSSIWTEPFSYILSFGVYLSDVFLVFFLVSSIKELKGGDNTHTRMGDIALLLFLGAAFLSTFFATIPEYSLLAAGKLVLFVLLYKTLRRMPFTTGFQLFFIAAISILLFEGTLSSLQYITKGKLHISIEAQGDYLWVAANERVAIEDKSMLRPMGTFSDPNFLGLYLTALLPFAWTTVLQKNTKKFSRILSFIATLLGLSGLLISGSRVSWAAAFPILFAITLYLKKKKHMVKGRFATVLFVGILGIIFIMVPISIIPRLLHIPETIAYGGGITYRWNLIEKALTLMPLYPLGIGLGMFPIDHFQTLGGSFSFPAEVHNLLVQIGVETGLFGICCFFIFLIQALLQGMKNIVKRTHLSNERFMVGGACVGYFILTMVYPILTEFPLVALLFLFSSLLEAPDHTVIA